MWDFEQLKAYLKMALPNFLSNFLGFLAYDTASFLAALIGVNEEAAMIVIMNLNAL